MDEGRFREREHLFIVRCWRETLDGGHSEWRGKIQHTGSGEVRYFRAWRILIQFIVARLGPPDDEHRHER